MANAERDFIVEKVKEVLAAPSCCPELKAAAQTYLDVLDTPDGLPPRNIMPRKGNPVTYVG